MLNRFKKFIFLLALLALVISPVFALAQEAGSGIQGILDDAAGNKGAGYNTKIDETTGIAMIAGSVVRAFLALLGILFVSYTIYGGFLWMTAGGNEERVTKAKSIIRNGVIGLIIILSAAAIYAFVITIFTTGDNAPLAR